MALLISNKEVHFIPLDLGDYEYAYLAKRVKDTLTLKSRAVSKIPEYNLQDSYEIFKKIFKPLVEFLPEGSKIITYAESYVDIVPFEILPSKVSK
jgi:hypothetical protein